MTRAALSALLSHWWRHPVQLATLLLGLALATALWSGVQAINAEARASYDAAARAAAGDARPALVDPEGAIPLDTYVRLRRAGWLVTPVVEGDLAATGGRVQLVGVDLLGGRPPALAGGDGRAETVGQDGGGGEPRGALGPEGEDAGRRLAEAIGVPGRLFAEAGTAARLTGPALPPVVVADGVPRGVVLADIGVADRLLGRDGAIDRLLVLEGQPLVQPPLSQVAPELELRPPGGAAEIARLTDSFHLNLTAFGLLAFAVGLFIVHGAVGLAFEQRRGMFRTLRALGLPRRRLVGLLAAELLLLALVAGAAGMALGGLIAAALLPDVAATLRGLYGASVQGELTLRPAWWAAGLAVAVAGTALAGAGALWKVARLPLLAPAQPRAWALASERTLRLQAGMAVALGLLALLLGVAGSGLVAGFAMLGALLVAAALLLPLWLTVWLHLGRRLARGPVAEWFWADTRQQLPGLGLALMALLLALATNIGVGTMVQSFRLTFAGWLDQRLAAELYVEVRDEAEGEALLHWLDGRAEVLPIGRGETRLRGTPVELYAVADHPLYREFWPVLAAVPDAWDRVARGEGVLVNEQLSRRERLSPGDALALHGWRTEVAGVYSDYGNPVGQILLSNRELARFPGATRRDFGLLTDDPPGLATELVEGFGLPPDAVVDQAEIKARSLEVFERTFAVTAALNVLTLGVAGVAILTSLLTLAAMRLPQLAPVWALGLTRAQLAWLELARSVLLAALTALAAVPVGLGLAWVLLAVINVEAFGWRLPMYVFPADWLRLGALSLAAAALASLWPARRLATRSPADLAKVFAHER